MARVLVRTLGTVMIEVGKRSIGPSAGRPFALLFYLTCRRGHPTPRRVLQELLYPRTAESQAGHSLRQLIYRVRQLGVRVDTDADGMQLTDADVWIDWLDILERGELGNEDMELLAQGLFPGFTPEVSEGYREWFEGERSAVRLKLCRAVGLQLSQLRRAARWDLVDTAARALLALDPMNEDGMVGRAQALAASGSKTAALGVIDAYEKELGDDQANLKLTPMALRRRISERLPEMGHRPQDDRIFVGRDDAMRMLSAVGAAARSGTQQTVWVSGEPGIGKTRLLSEYKSLACLQGSFACHVTCQAHDVFRPLGILSDLVDQLLQAPGALGCDPDKRALLTRIVSAANGSLRQREADQISDAPLPAIISALEDLLSAIASELPVVIFIDDAHWLDRTSLTAILSAFSAREVRRACVVFASRDRAPFSSTTCVGDDLRTIRLYPLDDRAALELVHSVLSRDSVNSLDVSDEQLVAQGRGNPFILRLLCRHIASTGQPILLEQTVAEILERRLEQLSPEATRVLEASVLLGKNCTHGRITRLLELSRLSLLRSVEELDDRGLIEVRDGCFLVSHALLRDPVERRMSPSVKRALHASAAELLQEESEHSGQGSVAWDCAEHWRLAEDHLSALRVLRGCAERSLNAGRPSDALATYKRALMLNTPDSVRHDLLEDAIRSVGPGIEWEEALELIPQLRDLRSRLGRPGTIHDTIEIIEFGAIFHGGSDPRVIVPRLRTCVGSAEASPQHRLAAARQMLMTAELIIDPEIAELAFASTRDLATGTPQQILCDLLYHVWFGNVNQAAELADELARLSLHECSSRARPEFISFLLNAGYAQSRIGRDDAEAILHEGLALAQRTGARRGAMHAYLFLAEHYWRNGSYTECIPWLKGCAEFLIDYSGFDALWEYELIAARVAIWEGRLEDAKASLGRAKRCGQSPLDLPKLLISACEIEMRVACGASPCSELELAELLALYHRAKNIGRQDETTTALATALQHYGRIEEARSLFQRYLTEHRRERFPLRPELARFKDSLLDTARRPEGSVTA